MYSLHDLFASRRRLSVIFYLPLLLIQIGCASPTAMQEDENSPFKAGNSETGEFVWHDLLTGEPEIARNFYGSLFGWGFESTGRATSIIMDQRVIGTIMEMPVTEVSHVARWVVSLGVADITGATEWTRQQGGHVHEGPLRMLNRGDVALVSDSQGAQIGLVELGEEKVMAPSPVAINDWLWDELWTKDIDKALEFYSGLYAFESLEATPGYWILKSGEQWRAGVRELFDRNLEQRWVPVIRVSDVESISARVQDLGGKLVLAAGQEDAEDMTALLADPGGALFMVQEWAGKDAVEGLQQ